MGLENRNHNTAFPIPAVELGRFGGAILDEAAPFMCTHIVSLTYMDICMRYKWEEDTKRFLINWHCRRRPKPDILCSYYPFHVGKLEQGYQDGYI